MKTVESNDSALELDSYIEARNSNERTGGNPDGTDIAKYLIIYHKGSTVREKVTEISGTIPDFDYHPEC